MGYKVSSLSIHKQTGDNNREVYAQWNFAPGSKTTTTTTTTTTNSGASKIIVGSWVKIKSGVTTWYNGVNIPASGIKNQVWKVTWLQGDRAVLGPNKAKTMNIQSPIKVSDLVVEGASDSGSSTTTTTTTDTSKCKENLDHLDKFQVRWYYYIPGNGWFLDQDTTKAKTPDSGSLASFTGTWRVTYTAKEEVTKVKVWVKPVSKKHKVVTDKKKNKTVEKDWWTGEGVSKEYTIKADTEPPQMSAPTVTIDGCKLTAILDISNNDENSKVSSVQFQIHNGKSTITSTSDKKTTVAVKARRATFNYTVPAGGTYRVRCRAINENGKTPDYGDWSDFASEVSSSPTATKITKLTAESDMSAKLEWTKINAADHYQIEYTQLDKYFTNSSETQLIDTTSSNTNPKVTSWHVANLEAGKEYYFRVRACKGDEHSAWSPIKSIAIGKKPNPPTTWSSTNTILEGGFAYFYWIHNTQDGSKCTGYDISIKKGSGSEVITHVDIDPGNADTPDRIFEYCLNNFGTTVTMGGNTIYWKVRTSGIYRDSSNHLVMSAWSDTKTVKVIDQPTIDLELYNYNNVKLSNARDNSYQGDMIVANRAVIDRYPFTIKAKVTTSGQKVIAYTLKIKADDEYVMVGLDGNDVWVNNGDVVYQKTWNVNDTDLTKKFSPGDVDLGDGVKYIITCEAVTNNGVSVETEIPITVSFIDTVPMDLDALVYVDETDYTAGISPYVYDDDGDLVLCRIDVYRREYDGKFVLIEGNINNNNRTIVVDPHPALDAARYRLVATNNTTGDMVYYDVPDTPIECPYIVINWDEAWASFEVDEGRSNILRETQISQLILKYNVNVSEQNDKDVSLVEYIGREAPVSYYGTQKGESGNWSVEIPKDDVETLYKLRKLARWMGDAYVREPSGTGYWANVSVSFNRNFDEQTIPVTINVTRVEGGA